LYTKSIIRLTVSAKGSLLFLSVKAMRLYPCTITSRAFAYSLFLYPPVLHLSLQSGFPENRADSFIRETVGLTKFRRTHNPTVRLPSTPPDHLEQYTYPHSV